MTWSLHSLEDSQLSCTAKLEAVVRGHVGQLSFNARLKERGGRKKKDVKSNPNLMCIACGEAPFRALSDLCCENAGR